MWAKLLSLTEPNTKQYARFICVYKVDNHSRNLHELKFSTKSLTSSRLICALNLYFAQKLLREAKIAQDCQNRKKLFQTPNVAQKLPHTIGTGPITAHACGMRCEREIKENGQVTK